MYRSISNKKNKYFSCVMNKLVGFLLYFMHTLYNTVGMTSHILCHIPSYIITV